LRPVDSALTRLSSSASSASTAADFQEILVQELDLDDAFLGHAPAS
jgi:hypothetical protein